MVRCLELGAELDPLQLGGLPGDDRPDLPICSSTDMLQKRGGCLSRAEWVALVGLVIVAGLEGYIEQRSPS